MFAVETGQMSSAKTEQISVKTGQMSAVETGQLPNLLGAERVMEGGRGGRKRFGSKYR